VAERYEILYEQNRSRMVKVDAEHPPEAVWEATKKLLKERLFL
jgi:thymidylate kinase